VLRFHDLAVDIGLARARGYNVDIESEDGRHQAREHVPLTTTEMALQGVGNGASRLSLAFSIPGTGSAPTRVELRRMGSDWILTRVRHG